ncbi:MAG: gliding motility lipoprotein GldD [Bacteroidia bacterium]
MKFTFFLNFILWFSSVLFLFESCEQAVTPKPRGFQRIQFPKKEFKSFTSDCGFTASIPVYSTMITDTFPGSEKCWYNLFYEPFNATLHLSYKPVRNREELVKMTEDSRTLVYKHTIRADEIYETFISNDYIHGMLYELSGNTATSFQFFVTDSTHHYLRGALYFNVKTNNDSVAPVLKFLKYDVIKMLESLRWN